MTKRGQITLFIIIGIVLVLSAALLIYLMSPLSFQETKVLPENVKPVTGFVEECTAIVGETAIRQLAAGGGWINVPQGFLLEPSSYLSLDKFNLQKLPYWYYDGKDYAPTLQVMEEELENYIAQNVETCLDEFTVFDDHFKVRVYDDPTAKVEIQKNNVLITLDYPIKIDTLDSRETAKRREFTTLLDANLREIHEFATDLLESENEQEHFERITMDLVSQNPDIPLTGFDFDCGAPKNWYLPTVKQQLQEQLFYNLPRIRFKNTAYVPFIAPEQNYERLKEKYPASEIFAGNTPEPGEKPEDAYEYFHYFLDVSDVDYPRLTAAARYLPNWGMDFIVTPSDGPYLKADRGTGPKKFLRFLCIQTYHFTYDIIYPLMVTITDQQSFEGQGLSFNYAIPIIITDNQGDRSPYAMRSFSPQNPDTSVCSDYNTDRVIDVRAVGAFDYTGIKEPLNGVNISYECFTHLCALGKTTAQGGVYRFSTFEPGFCANGYLIAQKDGYLEGRTQLTSASDTVQIEMKKLRELDYDVVPIDSRDLTVDDDFEPDEQVLIHITETNTGYEIYKTYPANTVMTDSDYQSLFGSLELPQDTTIELLEDNANYELDLLLIEGNNIVGGYKAEWNVKFVDIIDENNMTFYVIRKHPPVLDDIQKQAELFDYIENGNYSLTVKPTFK
ncbi:hypothetical protein GOV04_00625 [Candidatus Woesearchaeota archaeon]|nr:hypothetical protein [Candidatus Woesearchaeota archaeon]